MTNYKTLQDNIEVSYSNEGVYKTAKYKNTDISTIQKRLMLLKNGDKDGSHYLRAPLKKDEYGKVLPRSNANLNNTAQLIVLDCDKSITSNGEQIVGAPDPFMVHKILEELNISHTMYATYSHYEGDKGNRYRINLPTNTPYTKEQLPKVVDYLITWINSKLVGNKLANAKENSVYAQPWYFSRKPENSTIEQLYLEHLDGNPVEIANIINDTLCVTANNIHTGTITPDKSYKSPIDLYNKNTQIEQLLARYGYLHKGNNKWLSPNSTSGQPGISVKDNKFYSHHDDEFNDKHAHSPFDLMRIKEGLTIEAAVSRIAKIAIAPNVDFEKYIHNDTKWTNPLELSGKADAKLEYPVNALPTIIRDAVNEVAEFTKAPVALVAASALSATSLACQILADVKRSGNLCGPISLFLLTIADSGERKSTCDEYFMRSLYKYESEQQLRAISLQKEYKAAKKVHDSKLKALTSKFNKYINNNKQTDSIEIEMNKLIYNHPVAPKIPRLIYSDITTEALKANLACWPSGGIVSSEGGIILGAHSMSAELRMRNFATYNQGWDGKGIPTDRVTSESSNVQQVRLTMSIQVQEPTLTEFMYSSGNLARGIGFFARCLLAHPESTQGTRFFTEAPRDWLYLEKFNAQISYILNITPPIDMLGQLSPTIIEFTNEAKEEWIKYHDNIEKELKQGANYSGIRDIASKSADNAARLAALLHIIENGPVGKINAQNFINAGKIALWYLNESKIFFNSTIVSNEFTDALLLDGWLINYCRAQNINELPIHIIQQNGPNRLRKKNNLEDPIRLLLEYNRIRVTKDNKKVNIAVNPILLNKNILIST